MRYPQEDEQQPFDGAKTDLGCLVWAIILVVAAIILVGR
jgi:hypothetical protein